MKRILTLIVLTVGMLAMYAGTAFAAGWWVEYGNAPTVAYDGRFVAPTNTVDGGFAVLDPTDTRDPDGTGPSGLVNQGNLGQGNPNTADGGRTPSPHGDFSTGTNKCKTCHAVHGANNDSFRLLHNSSRLTECDWCHDAATGRSAHRPYGELYLRTGQTARGEHTVASQIGKTIGGVLVTDLALDTRIPDSNVNGGTTFGNLPNMGDNTSPPALNCYTCHSVHGAGTLGVLAGERYRVAILRSDPAGNGTPLGNGAGGANTPVIVDSNGTTQPFDSGVGMVSWQYERARFCADCHNKNPNFGGNQQGNTNTGGGSRPNPGSHPTRGDGLLEIYGQNDQQVSFGLDNCFSCHEATTFTKESVGGTSDPSLARVWTTLGPSDFPHQSIGHKLLKDTYVDADLPGVDSEDPMRPLRNMDKICLGCHTQNGLGGGSWGVGITF